MHRFSTVKIQQLHDLELASTVKMYQLYWPIKCFLSVYIFKMHVVIIICRESNLLCGITCFYTVMLNLSTVWHAFFQFSRFRFLPFSRKLGFVGYYIMTVDTTLGSSGLLKSHYSSSAEFMNRSKVHSTNTAQASNICFLKPEQNLCQSSSYIAGAW